MRKVLPAALAAGTVTVIAGVALAAAGPHTLLVEQGWLIALALIGAIALARDVAPPIGSWSRSWFAARRRPAPRPLPEALQGLATLMELGMAGEFELHFRVRPFLVETAAARLRWKRGIDLEADPAAAAEALGPAAWRLLRPDRPEPPGRGTRGDGAAAIRQVVEALERL